MRIGIGLACLTVRYRCMCLTSGETSRDGRSIDTCIPLKVLAFFAPHLVRPQICVVVCLGTLTALLKPQLNTEKLILASAGRTDKGVSACGQVTTRQFTPPKALTASQVVSFYTWEQISLNQISTAFSNLCSESVRVWWIQRVPRSFHATFQAQTRRYIYLFPLDTQIPNDAFEGMISVPDIDVAKVQRLLQSLVGRSLDYNAFARDTPANKDCRCILHECRAFKTALSLPSAQSCPHSLDCLCIEVCHMEQAPNRLNV